MVPLQSVVLANDTLVDVGNEEKSGQKGKRHTGANRDTGDPVSGLLVEPKLRRTLVDDGQGADSTGDQEEERRGVNSPWDWVDSHMDGSLDEHEDGGTENSRDEGSHDETSEDSTKTGAVCDILSAELRPQAVRCTYCSIPTEHPLHQQ